jgi:glycosyltransferase involved in cell wall biosynthesis
VDSLNFGIKKANSQLIARMDADDIMHPQRLFLQVERLERKRELGLISCLVNHVPIGDHDTRGYKKYVTWINQICSTHEISLNRFIESPFAHPSVVFRRKLVSKYGGYRKGDFPEDYELWLRFLDKGVQMEKVNNYLLDWQDSKDRISRTGFNYKLGSFQHIKSIYLKKWIEKMVPANKFIHAWGAGKFAKQQIKYLNKINISVDCTYDIDPKKITNGQKVHHINKIPKPGHCFILCLVGKGDARGEITEFLSKKGYIIEKDFIFAA